MQLIISRLKELYYGFEIAFKQADKITRIGLINGNKPDYLGPVILLNIDQHVVYGMSHPKAIAEIYEKGPQPLLSTKELGHRLFEHGMKAAIGKVRLRNNTFSTTLDTFYTPMTSYENLEIIQGQAGKVACLVKGPVSGALPILLSHRNFKFKENYIQPLLTKTIEMDDIHSYLTVPFEVNSLEI